MNIYVKIIFFWFLKEGVKIVIDNYVVVIFVIFILYLIVSIMNEYIYVGNFFFMMLVIVNLCIKFVIIYYVWIGDCVLGGIIFFFIESKNIVIIYIIIVLLCNFLFNMGCIIFESFCVCSDNIGFSVDNFGLDLIINNRFLFFWIICL